MIFFKRGGYHFIFEYSLQCTDISKTFLPILAHIFLQMDVVTFVITGISIPLLVFTIFVNFLVMAVIHKNKRLQNAKTCLIFQLATSDFGFALVSFTETILVSNNVPCSSFQFVMNLWVLLIFLLPWHWRDILLFWSPLGTWNEPVDLWCRKSFWRYGFCLVF